MTPGSATLDRFTGSADALGWIELCHGDALVERHQVSRWLLDADPADLRMLSRCAGPTVDVGCGPGRLTHALSLRGLVVLGVDLDPGAVRRTRARGAPALLRDAFGPLPGEGRWRHVVLADGNIGIGGDPERLLDRLALLLDPAGTLLVEVSAREVDHRGTSRVRAADGRWGPRFAWAVLGADALARLAGSRGWRVVEDWTDTGRRFLALTRPPGASPQIGELRA